MKKALVAVIVAILAAASGLVAAGQAALAQSAPAPSRAVSISTALYFGLVTLELRDGTTVVGRLSGATAGSIRVQKGGQENDYALADIRKVTIDGEPQRSRGVLPGVVFGLYAGNAALVWADEAPGFYTRRIEEHSFRSLWLFFGEAVYAAVGGGLGWLAYPGGGRQVFEFPDELDRAPGTAERFARFLAGDPGPARVHLTMLGGFLVPGVTPRFRAFAEDNGFVRQPYGSYLTKFSVLRSLELSYSVRPRWRTGLRVSFPSEPSYDFYSRSDEAVGSWTSLTQEFRATAVYATGTYELMGWRSRSGLAAGAGLGAGIASVRLTRWSYTYGGPVYFEGAAEVRKTLLSAVVFGDIRYRLTPLLSIGLAADLTFMPAVAVPAWPENGVPGGAQRLSNGSLGFVIGYHF